MAWTRYALLAVALLVSCSVVASTGGVSSNSLSRGLDGAVVSDEDAYLGLEWDCSEGTVRVTITNQFAPASELDVEVTVNGTTRRIEELEPEESRPVQFNGVEIGDSVQIYAAGPSTTVELTRTLPADC